MAQVNVTVEQGSESATLVNGYEYLAAGPVLHTADSKFATTSGGTATVDKPDNVVAGDMIVLIRHDSHDSNEPDPSGFTLIVDERAGVGLNRGRVTAWYKVATGSEPATYDVAVDNWGLASAHRITGFNTGTPIGSTSGDSANSSRTSSVITGITANSKSLLVSMVAAGTADPGAFSVSGAGLSIFLDENASFGWGAVASVQDLAAGATGNVTWSWVNSTNAASALFEVNAP